MSIAGDCARTGDMGVPCLMSGGKVARFNASWVMVILGQTDMYENITFSELHWWIVIKIIVISQLIHKMMGTRRFSEIFWQFYDNYLGNQLICISITLFYKFIREHMGYIHDVIFHDIL